MYGNNQHRSTRTESSLSNPDWFQRWNYLFYIWVNIIYLNFSKDFDTNSHAILLSTMELYGLEGWTIKCMANKLQRQEGHILEASKSGVLHKSGGGDEVLSYQAWNLYQTVWECGCATKTLNSRAVIQKKPDMLEEWADRTPNFCQHAKTAKLWCLKHWCSVLPVWEQLFRKGPGGFSVWRIDHLRETKQPAQPSVPGGSQNGGAPSVNSACCENKKQLS